MSTVATAERARRRRVPWWRDPWRKPRILQAATFGYLTWSLIPVVIAIMFSFNSGRSRSTWQGFSFRWWWQDPFDSLFKDEALRSAMLQTFRLAAFTTILAVAIGTAFAIGVDRWRGRVARGASFGMILQFVVPELILSIALFMLFTQLLKDVLGLGTLSQVIGLTTFQLSYAVIIIRARMLTIGPEYEEAAMDLGASPGKALRRVLLPLLTPAIIASSVLVFADAVDNFVTVRYLSGSASSEPLSVKIYIAARSSPTPAVNAAATVMLLGVLAMIAVGWFASKRVTRGTGDATEAAFAGL